VLQISGGGIVASGSAASLDVVALLIAQGQTADAALVAEAVRARAPDDALDTVGAVVGPHLQPVRFYLSRVPCIGLVWV